MSWLLEPFGYHYMLNALWVSALVGGVCAFLSCYLMLKGWSLIGDALSHSIVPGGLLVISYTTRLTPRISFTIRPLTRAKTS